MRVVLCPSCIGLHSNERRFLSDAAHPRQKSLKRFDGKLTMAALILPAVVTIATVTTIATITTITTIAIVTTIVAAPAIATASVVTAATSVPAIPIAPTVGPIATVVAAIISRVTRRALATVTPISVNGAR